MEKRPRKQRVRHAPGKEETSTTSSSSKQSNEDTNVAVAETVREYEPVMFLESKPKVDQQKPFTKPVDERVIPKQREILSNWNKFEKMTMEEEIELGEDHLMGEDFSEILTFNENNIGANGHFQLKGESSWGEEDDYVGPCGLGALKFSELAESLATIPLHERLKIPENLLPISTISHYKKLAEDKRKSYKFDATIEAQNDINFKIIQSLREKDTNTDNYRLENSGNLYDKTNCNNEELVIEMETPDADKENVILSNKQTSVPPPPSNITVDIDKDSSRKSIVDDFEFKIPSDAKSTSLHVEENAAKKHETPSENANLPVCDSAKNPSTTTKLDNKKPALEKVDEPKELVVLPATETRTAVITTENSKPVVDSAVEKSAVSHCKVESENKLKQPQINPSNTQSETNKKNELFTFKVPSEMPPKSVKVEIPNQSETDELEDWLDSVLDS